MAFADAFDDFSGDEDEDKSAADAEHVIERPHFGYEVMLEQSPDAPPDRNDADDDDAGSQDFFPALEPVERFPDTRVEVACREPVNVPFFFLMIVLDIGAIVVELAAGGVRPRAVLVKMGGPVLMEYRSCFLGFVRRFRVAFFFGHGFFPSPLGLQRTFHRFV